MIIRWEASNLNHFSRVMYYYFERNHPLYLMKFEYGPEFRYRLFRNNDTWSIELAKLNLNRSIFVHSWEDYTVRILFKER